MGGLVVVTKLIKRMLDHDNIIGCLGHRLRFQSILLAIHGMLQREEMRKHFSLVALAASLVGTPVWGTILEGPIEDPGNHHNYVLLTPDTWTNSEAEAVALGGALVTINDQAEQDWVFETFATGGGDGRALWTGLHRASVGGTFEWVSGDPVAYTHWASGEPNFADEWAVYMLPNVNGTSGTGYWNNDYDRTTATYSGLGYSIPAFSIYGVVELVPSPPTVALGITTIVFCRLRRSRLMTIS